MNVKLSDTQQHLIDQQIASGDFASAIEVIEAGLRLLEAQQQWQKDVQKKIDEGLADAEAGRLHNAEVVFDAIESRLSSDIETGKA